MLTPSISPVFSHKITSPHFAANQRPVAAKSAQLSQAVLQKDAWQKLQAKQKQEAATRQVLQDWERFRKEKLSIYSAPSVHAAADQMTEALKRQIELAKRYTSGALENCEAAGKPGKRQRLLFSVRSRLGLS